MRIGLKSGLTCDRRLLTALFLLKSTSLSDAWFEAAEKESSRWIADARYSATQGMSSFPSSVQIVLLQCDRRYRYSAKGEDIQSRLNGFALQVMVLRDGLPRTFAGKHLGEQLFRPGTACVANYAWTVDRFRLNLVKAMDTLHLQAFALSDSVIRSIACPLSTWSLISVPGSYMKNAMCS
jgi:hypothetical protein